MKSVTAAILLLAGAGSSLAISWPLAFTVQGEITIPFAEIQEPFLAYVDFPNKRSRIDYYGGMDQTYQRGDLGGESGIMFKIVPMVNNHLESDLACFQVNGTKDAPVSAQSILPDMTGFKNLGKDMLNGEECEKWQKIDEVGDKVNKYTMWVKIIASTLNPKLNIAIPLHYEMKGFNSLLGSHYDHYYLTYRNFFPDPPQSSIFDEYQTHGKCGGMPGPGVSKVYHMNPAKEFVDHVDEHVDSAFEEFKAKHGKDYGSRKGA